MRTDEKDGDLGGDLPGRKPVLATLVTKTLRYEVLPDWGEYRAAAWAIQDTIERVAPEVA